MVSKGYLTKEQIEKDAQAFLEQSYQCDILNVPLAFDVDGLVETTIGYQLAIDDLNSLFKVPSILGAICPTERIVYVDETLEQLPERYRFTVVHELGHYQYHVSDVKQPTLFETGEANRILCRTDTIGEVNTKVLYDPIEWQANYYGSCLLMPKPLIKAMIEDTLKACCQPDNLTATNQGFVSYMAKQFGVSQQAMRIRLEEPELATYQQTLILTKKREELLFRS
jgi:hypothetical protein